MIISHKYKYLFIAIPHTASTAIRTELCEMYDGIEILNKHSHFIEFKRMASAEEINYFVFTGIRNPLDEAVSWYFKLKSDHKERYSRQIENKKNRNLINKPHIRRYNFIKNTDASFDAYFKKYFKLPYSNIISTSYPYCDYVVRFENLQEDFSKALELIGIQQKRPLPLINPTNQRQRDYLSYYTPEIKKQAKRIFGPYMKKWGYEIPNELGDPSISWFHNFQFYIVDFIKNFTWSYIKNSPYFYGSLFRKIR